jgi:hypothetical protein
MGQRAVLAVIGSVGAAGSFFASVSSLTAGLGDCEQLERERTATAIAVTRYGLREEFNEVLHHYYVKILYLSQ